MGAGLLDEGRKEKRRAEKRENTILSLRLLAESFDILIIFRMLTLTNRIGLL